MDFVFQMMNADSPKDRTRRRHLSGPGGEFTRIGLDSQWKIQQNVGFSTDFLDFLLKSREIWVKSGAEQARGGGGSITAARFRGGGGETNGGSARGSPGGADNMALHAGVDRAGAGAGARSVFNGIILISY